MDKIWTLAVKDLRLLMADKIGLFFVWFFPLIFVVFFGYALSGLYGDGDGGEGLRAIPVVIVDEDRSPASQDLIRTLSAQGALRPEPADTRSAGEDLVRRGRRPACIIIPEGFQTARDNVFAGRLMELEVIVDPSRPMEAAATRGLLQASLFRQFRDLFTPEHLRRGREEVLRSKDLSEPQRLILGSFLLAAERFAGQFDPDDEPAATSPAGTGATGPAGSAVNWQPFSLRVQEITQAPREAAGRSGHPHNAFSILVPQGIAWGVMACAATFAVTMVVERSRGTLPRLLIAPLHRWQVLAGKGLACFISTGSVMIGMLILARLVFRVRPDSIGLLLAAVVCIGIAVVGVMMLFSVIGRTPAAVEGASWAVVVIMAMLGGGMIPLSQMGGWLQTLSIISIYRWAIQALDGAIWRGYSFTDMLEPCGVLLAIGVAGFALGASVFRWQSLGK